MKTTLDIPDVVLRGAKARAAMQGISLRKYVSQALEEKARASTPLSADAPPWMRGFGELSDLREENRRIDSLISAEFSDIDPEDLP